MIFFWIWWDEKFAEVLPVFFCLGEHSFSLENQLAGCWVSMFFLGTSLGLEKQRALLGGCLLGGKLNH